MSGGRARRALEGLAGVGLATALLWLFLRDVDWAAAGRAAASARVELLLLCCLGNGSVLLIRSLRWRLMLRPLLPDLALGPAWRAFTIGFVLSSLLPGRPGEVVRPYLLARGQGIGFAPIFATVVTERVLDLLTVLAFLGVGFLVPGVVVGAGERAAEAVDAIWGVGLLAALGVLGTGLFLALLRLRTAAALRLVGLLTRWLPAGLAGKLERLVRSFAEGVGGLAGGAQLLGVLGWTLLSWLVLAASLWTALAAFGLACDLPRMLFFQAVIALGVAIPTPAGAGTYHAGAVSVLSLLWGQDAATVAAFAVVSHLVAYVPALLCGVASILREGLGGLSAIDEARRASEAEPSGGGEGLRR